MTEAQSRPAARVRLPECRIERVSGTAFVVPTETPESDGTHAWSATTLVLAEASAGGTTGIGYTYTDRAAVPLIRGVLAQAIQGQDALDIPGAWQAMNAALRNIGRPGLGTMALSAVDAALWDLKGRLLDLPLSLLLGRVRESVPVYGSGGFTSYTVPQLRGQLERWATQGMRFVKMKVGREPEQDCERVAEARKVIGNNVELFVDANGAYARKQALAFAQAFAQWGVSWFEEPVSSDDLEGLRLLRDRGPAGMDVAAGEYGYDANYFGRLLGAVDVLQADATRCGGITGFLQIGALCAARAIPLSAHTAPALHLAPCCALPAVRHIEYFHDHVRVEQLLFEGAAVPVDGTVAPDVSRPGLGLELKRADAERFAALT